MARYRKLPVEIEAVQFEFSASPDEAYEWALENSGDRCVILKGDDDGHHILIETLEGTMRAHEGDWLIMGVSG